MLRSEIVKAMHAARAKAGEAECRFAQASWWNMARHRLAAEAAAARAAEMAYCAVLMGGEHFVRSGCGDTTGSTPHAMPKTNAGDRERKSPGASPGETQAAPSMAHTDRPLNGETTP